MAMPQRDDMRGKIAAAAADALSRRKRKNYVRAVKRRPKPYPLLTKPRSEYRQEEVI